MAGNPVGVESVGDDRGRKEFSGRDDPGLAPSGNTDLNWFTDLLELIFSDESLKKMCYMLIWANFSDTQFWAPYVKGDFCHEMVEDFENFLTDDRILLAKSC